VVDFKLRPFCEQDTGWAVQVVWKSWKTEKPLSSTEVRNPDRLVHRVTDCATPARGYCIWFQKNADDTDSPKVVLIFAVKYTTPHVNNL
jgi:hypothetical protein